MNIIHVCFFFWRTVYIYIVHACIDTLQKENAYCIHVYLAPKSTVCKDHHPAISGNYDIICNSTKTKQNLPNSQVVDPDTGCTCFRNSSSACGRSQWSNMRQPNSHRWHPIYRLISISVGFCGSLRQNPHLDKSYLHDALGLPQNRNIEKLQTNESVL